MKLTQELKEKREASRKMIPENIYNEMQKATQELADAKLGSDSIKVGEKLPNHTLLNESGSEQSVEDSFGDHNFLVLSFYRGGWCPYCNIELKALQDSLPDLNSFKAGLVAITPETPEHSSETKNNNSVDFTVLTDKASKLSKEIGIAFELPERLKPIYAQFGLDVKKHNGDFTLPIPATFVIDRDLNVLYKFVDVDYTQRLDPVEVVNFIKKQQQ